VKIGVPSEIKDREFRVGMTPAGVATLTARSHQVFVETNAGLGSGFSDQLRSLCLVNMHCSTKN
jgi:alanine dehydrogenase